MDIYKYLFCGLIMSACSEAPISVTQDKDLSRMNDLVLVVVDKPIPTELEKMIFENPALSNSEICTIFFPEEGEPDCNPRRVWKTFEYDNKTKIENKFSFTFPDKGDFQIFIKRESGLGPIQSDGRNSSPVEDLIWVSNLSVVYKDENLIVPISPYASLPIPSQIEVILGEKSDYSDFSILFHSNGSHVTQYSFKEFNCGEETSYELKSAVSWLPRMFGDSYQKTILRMPLCN